MEIDLAEINGYEFSNFIKKLLPIDKFIFMKVGKEYTLSSVYLPERDAVKLVTVKTEDLFGADTIETPVKVSFYNGTKVNDALAHFGASIRGSIKYDEQDGENMAGDFTIGSDDLEINLACADPSLSFMEMTKDEMKRAFSTEESVFEFDLLTTHVDRMKSLFSLDKEEEVFTLYVGDRGISVKGTSYDALLSQNYEGSGGVGSKVTIYKKYLQLLDKENYRVVVCENKLVFKSLDTNTQLTVAVAITDD
jgi:hypothetical protein